MVSTSRKGRKNTIQNDYGMRHYYNFFYHKYRKHVDKYNISSSLYLKIVSDFNQSILKQVCDDGVDYELPFQLGTVAVRKYKPKIELASNGQLINYLPVNPVETLKLWNENPEAREKKIYIKYVNKHSNGFVFLIKYFKTKAKFKNKTAYFIKFKRTMTRRLANNIKNNTIDALLIN